MTTAKTVPEYIAAFPKDAQKHLKQFRALIKKLAPSAEEKMAYGMPGYKLNGKVFVYFGAHKNHIGFYATPTANAAFKKDLSKYKFGKGSIQFPMNEPLPIPLITKMLRFKITEIKGSKKS